MATAGRHDIPHDISNSMLQFLRVKAGQLSFHRPDIFHEGRYVGRTEKWENLELFRVPPNLLPSCRDHLPNICVELTTHYTTASPEMETRKNPIPVSLVNDLLNKEAISTIPPLHLHCQVCQICWLFFVVNKRS